MSIVIISNVSYIPSGVNAKVDQRTRSDAAAWNKLNTPEKNSGNLTRNASIGFVKGSVITGTIGKHDGVLNANPENPDSNIVAEIIVRGGEPITGTSGRSVALCHSDELLISGGWGSDRPVMVTSAGITPQGLWAASFNTPLEYWIVGTPTITGPYHLFYPTATFQANAICLHFK